MKEWNEQFDAEDIDDLLELDEEITEQAPVPDENGMYEHFRFVADRGQKLLRIDKYLVDRLEAASRNRVQNAADAGYIYVNGKPVKSNYKVKPLDEISIRMDRPRHDTRIVPEDIPLEVVYEDSELMVVNKPAGMVVHPGHGHFQGTLVHALAFHMQNNPEYDANDPRMGLVHRIDKDTSGLLVVAKTPHAKTHLGAQFFNKTTQRMYTAVVWGTVQEDQGRIEGHIGRSQKDKLQMIVYPDGDYGKSAVTHYTVQERLGYVTVVTCKLETGRTHQIRVHMKHIGHTLFNDARYGGHEVLKGTTFAKYKQFVKNCFDTCPRQALHAQTLGFIHPTTGEEMFFEAPLADDMVQLIERWRGYISNRDLD